MCIAVYVYSKDEAATLPTEDHPTVERHLRFAENLHIPTEVIHGKNRPRSLVDYAHKNGATQLFLNRSGEPHRRWFPGQDFQTGYCSTPQTSKSQSLPNVIGTVAHRRLIPKMRRVR